MGVEAHPEMGGLLCDTRVDGNRRSCLQRAAEGAEWSDAAGQLHGDVHRFGERHYNQHGSDSFHCGIKPKVRRHGCCALNGRDIEQVGVKRLEANEKADVAQLLTGSRVVDVMQLVIEVILN